MEKNGTLLKPTNSHSSSKSFDIIAADGSTIAIPAGEYYVNVKARTKRLMRNSLSSDARRVYACLETATMFWRRELALANNGDPLTPSDIAEQTGIVKQHVTAALRELEEQGLAERRSDDGGELRRGHILIYSWATPQPPREEESNPAGLQSSSQFPAWVPESWNPLKPIFKRLRVRLNTELVTARDSILEEGAEIARRYEQAEKDLRALLERVSAQPDLYKEERKKRKTEKIVCQSVSSVLEVTTEDRPTDIAPEDLPPPAKPTVSGVPGRDSGGCIGGSAAVDPQYVSSRCYEPHLRYLELAIPIEVWMRCGLPSNALLARIHENLQGAPAKYFTQRIQQRLEDITSLGLLPYLAKDVGDAWVKHQEVLQRIEKAREAVAVPAEYRQRIAYLRQIDKALADPEFVRDFPEQSKQMRQDLASADPAELAEARGDPKAGVA